MIYCSTFFRWAMKLHEKFTLHYHQKRIKAISFILSPSFSFCLSLLSFLEWRKNAARGEWFKKYFEGDNMRLPAREAVFQRNAKFFLKKKATRDRAGFHFPLA
jgi:hypothetical protein